MSYFLSSILHQFLLPTLLLIWLWRGQRGWPAGLGWGLLGAAVAAWALTVQLAPSLSLQLISQAAYLLILLLILAGVFFPLPRWLALLATTGLLLLETHHWLAAPQMETLTRTDVINTELILNLAALLLGLGLLTGTVAIARPLMLQQRRGGRTLALWCLLLLALPLAGEMMLALIKLEQLELTSLRLSFISKVTNFNWASAYLGLAGLLALVARWTWTQVRRQQPAAQDDILRWRRQTAAFRQRRRVSRLGYLLVLLSVGSMMYWDLWASRPPSLSAATRVYLAEDGRLHLPVEPLKDGKLHRFAWVADDGKLVRFFVINRYEDQFAPGVVFDACMLCGDQGYIQQGNQIICVACGVRIFPPSIGKPSGCNPIPMEDWQLANGELLISQATLEAGLRYFSAVLEVAVTDPVGGEPLTNTEAPFRYRHGGKTWFFASEANYDAFRADPARYLGGR